MVAALRRSPVTARHASVGAIAVGAALFVVASIAAPLAGADASKHRHATKSLRHDNLSPFIPVLPTSAAASTPDPKVVQAKAKAAPVDHGAISALAANGIPKVALNAYRVAAARLGNVQSSCGIDWSLLAGIGREESDHGRFAGAVLHADGTSTPRIIGPALDGVKWDRIAAPANGLALDGDAKYAHALGPMQFIPSTWAGYGADATGDDKADIFNINDAALGAARYLCAAGGDLRTRPGRVRAVLAYNHNDQYLAQVLALADAYKRGVPISGIPVGNIKGKLPKIAHTGVIPPANPGAPTAAEKAAQVKNAAAAKSKSAAAKSSSNKPAPSHSSAAPRPSSTPPAKPGSSSPKPSSSSPKPSPTPSTAPKTCNPLQIILGCKAG